MRIRVDVSKCLGNGLCEATAEDLFEVGDDAVVRVLVESPPEDRLAAVRKAVEDCPVGALSLEE